jgi:hypothetical protein
MLTLITGIPQTVLLKLFPLFTISLYGSLSFLILRVRLKTSYALMGAGSVIGMFFLRQHYFGPPGIAYVFFLMGFLVVTWLFFDAKVQGRTLKGLFLVIFAAAVFTHFLTSLMLLAMIVTLYVSQRIIFKKSSAITARLCLLSGVILVAYNMFVNINFFNTVISLLTEVLSGLRGLTIFRESSRIVVSPANRMSYYSSWGIVVLSVVLASVSMFKSYKSFRYGKRDEGIGYYAFLILFLIVLGIFGVVAEYGPHEAYQRAFMFGMLPLVFLFGGLLVRRPKIMIMVLVIFLFLNIPAQYAGDSYTLATQNQLSGAKFFAQRSPSGATCLDEFSLYVRYYEPAKDLSFRTLGGLPFSQFPNASKVYDAIRKVDYVVLSKLQENYYDYFLGKSPFEQVDLGSLNRLYDSKDFEVFMNSSLALPEGSS